MNFGSSTIELEEEMDESEPSEDDDDDNGERSNMEWVRPYSTQSIIMRQLISIYVYMYIHTLVQTILSYFIGLTNFS